MSSWLRYKETALDPLSALDALKDGRLTGEHVDALAENYPPLLEEIKARALEHITAGAGKSLPYGEKVQMGILLGMPTTALMVPEVMASIQEVYAPGGGAEPGGSDGIPSGGRRKSSFSIERSEDLETRSERVEGA
jgi:hypothetical protein